MALALAAELQAQVAELQAQVAYQRRLTRLLGWYDAARYRVAMATAPAGQRHAGTIRLHPRCLLHPVLIRIGSTDADVYHQVLRQEEYGAIEVDDARVIVDCGANVGYTSAFLLSRYPEAQVIAIEPFPANAELCRQNLAPYGNRARVIEAAVWHCATRLTLDHDGGLNSGGIDGGGNDGGGNEWGVRVRAVRDGEAGEIEAVDIASLGLPRIDILKIDIESSEADLFSANTALWLPAVRNIAIELHDDRCREVFYAALSDYVYRPAASGELTFCRDLRQKAGG